jgi:hypothetical protein
VCVCVCAFVRVCIVCIADTFLHVTLLTCVHAYVLLVWLSMLFIFVYTIVTIVGKLTYDM